MKEKIKVEEEKVLLTDKQVIEELKVISKLTMPLEKNKRLRELEKDSDYSLSGLQELLKVNFPRPEEEMVGTLDALEFFIKYRKSTNKPIKDFQHLSEQFDLTEFDKYTKDASPKMISSLMSLKREWLTLTKIAKAEEHFFPTKEKIDKPMIKLPSGGTLTSDYAKKVGNVFEKKEVIFYRPSSKEVLEISIIKDKGKEEEYIGFSAIKPERFVTLSENFFTPFIEYQTKRGIETMPKSMSSNISSILLKSPQLQDKLPNIKRIFLSPIPIIHNGILTFPMKGYDKRFLSFLPFDSPNINENLPLEEAKEIINQIYKEFCFQDRKDYMNTIAGLLTPFLRGLFPSFSERAPLFVYVANRERAGKDYCADITGLVYEGYALQEPPISNGERSNNANEELRKKLLSGFLTGRKRMHFSNNKGYINNAVLEQVLTNQKYSDRPLGKNDLLNMDNEIDYSLSGNIGIRFTPDLLNRSRLIRLFLDIEDANARQFNNPNLHNWVRENRGLILSALFSLVRNWFDKGSPDGKVPFASYPIWAKICGGIMEAAGYDNPCITDHELLSIGGDQETQDMKMLFEICYDKYKDQWITKNHICEIISKDEDNLFGYIDLNERAGQTKFGLKISKFIGRVLSDITFKVKDKGIRSSRQQFMFTKEIIKPDREKIFGEENKGGNVGNFGNVTNLKSFEE